MKHVFIVGEGASDVAALKRLVALHGLNVAGEYDCRGKSKLDSRLQGFLEASKRSPWVILRDLDNDAPCAPTFLENRSIQPPPLACFRLAVRTLESWLLADVEGISSWLKVRPSKVPMQPELIPNPKHAVANLASASSSKEIRMKLAPRGDDGAIVGSEYNSAIFSFVSSHWNVQSALDSGRAPSLIKASARIGELSEKLE